MTRVGAGMLVCLIAGAQGVPSSPSPDSDAGWRRALQGLPDQPGSNTSVQDADRFAQNLELAAPYFATLAPGDYEANRELVRRMWAYSAALDVIAGRNPQMRLSAGRARRALSAWGFGFPFVQGGGQPTASNAPPPPPPAPGAPPFAIPSPALENVPAAERASADALRSRYESSAARAAAAWESAEVLRQNLARQGMALNTQTATSVVRLQLYFELAAGDMREHDWTEANNNLERAEYETEKVFKTVGR